VLLKGVEAAAATLARVPADPSRTPRGAALLGVAGTVVVCHGAATGADLASGIALAALLVRADMARRLAASGGAARHAEQGPHGRQGW
jgi:glycerol-3-phosphate acyltransferase PlsX